MGIHAAPRRPRLLLLLPLLLAAPLPARAQTPATIQGRALEQMQLLMREKLERTPAQAKLDSQLLMSLKRRQGDPWMARLPDLRLGVEIRADGRTLVDVAADVTPELEQRLSSLGAEIVSSHPEWRRLRAWAPMDALLDIAASPEIDTVVRAERAMTDVSSEGDRAHLADQARQQFGVDGSGVKVCVISDGVGSLTALQAAGELPRVDVLPGSAGNGTEGTAMLEIINDLAPGAELGFATGQGGQATFAQNILRLRQSGCDVIVDDLRYLAEAVLQDGIVAQGVAQATADGALYFASAGNGGGISRGSGGVWEGNFSPAPVPQVIQDLAEASGLDSPQAANRFGGGDIGNQILDDPRLGIMLTWSDPFQGSSNDYDLFLLDSTLSNVIAASTGSQTGNQFPQEFIDSDDRNDAGRRLVIVLFRGQPRFLHLTTFDGELGRPTAGQTSGHAAVPAAFSVASSFAGLNPQLRFPDGRSQRASSDGPRRVFFAANGAELRPGSGLLAPGGVVRAKPDIAAADGVQTNTPGFERFFGTSAAAPHAAAIAALVLSANPSLTPAQVRLVLTASSQDIDAEGFDNDSGAGIPLAPFAVALAQNGLPACADAVDNDNDGAIDFPADPGCASGLAGTESPTCDDGIDNDSDGFIDLSDSDCTVASSGNEGCGMGSMQAASVLPLMLYLGRRGLRARRRSLSA